MGAQREWRQWRPGGNVRSEAMEAQRNRVNEGPEASEPREAQRHCRQGRQWGPGAIAGNGGSEALVAMEAMEDRKQWRARSNGGLGASEAMKAHGHWRHSRQWRTRGPGDPEVSEAIETMEAQRPPGHRCLRVSTLHTHKQRCPGGNRRLGKWRPEEMEAWGNGSPEAMEVRKHLRPDALEEKRNQRQLSTGGIRGNGGLETSKH